MCSMGGVTAWTRGLEVMGDLGGQRGGVLSHGNCMCMPILNLHK